MLMPSLIGPAPTPGVIVQFCCASAELTQSITKEEDGSITGRIKEEKIVEDVKGHRERGYIDKRKLVRDKFGINVVEV